MPHALLSEIAGLPLTIIIASVSIFMVRWKGIVTAIPTLGYSGAIVVWLIVVGDGISIVNYGDYISAGIFGAMFGMGCFILLRKRGRFSNVSDSFRLSWAKLTQDYRLYYIIVALAASIFLTFLFQQIVSTENPRDFWHGFYEAWMASMMFFTTLGIAGVAISLYRPEHDNFDTRVRILCGGRTDSTVDYIRDEVRNVGYYTEKVDRVYRIKRFDSLNKTYYIEVESTSHNKNFYEDININHHGNFEIRLDKIDPAPDPYGEVSFILVDGENKLDNPIKCDENGTKKEWEVEIKRGKPAIIHLKHAFWYLADKEHGFRPQRFTKSISVRVVCECATAGQTPVIHFRSDKCDISEALKYNTPLDFPIITDRKPRERAFSFTLTAL